MSNIVNDVLAGLLVLDPWCPKNTIFVMPAGGDWMPEVAIRCMVAGWRWI